MRKFGGGIGLVMLVIVMVIVLLLVARSWRSVAPTALEVSGVTDPAGIDEHGETGAAEATRSGQSTNLGEMKQQTDAHADELKNALEETNQ